MSSASATSPALQAFEATFNARGSDPLSPVREQAMQRFLRLGLPSARDETWRYTSLKPLSGRRFVDAPAREWGAIEPTASVSLVDATQRAATVSVMNGMPRLHTIDSVINDIEISSLSEISRLDPKLLLRFMGPLSDDDERRFDLLNTALFRDGLYLKVTKRVETPLVILNVGMGESSDSAAYPRLIIDVAPGASATIIEHHVDQGEHAPLVNSLSHIALGAGAQLEHYRVFATGATAVHLDSLEVRQEQDSTLKQFTIALGGGLVRTNLQCHLNQRGASLDSHSLLVGHGSRHVDCVNVVRHAAPDTKSRQTARSIASELSRVVFNSKVIVNSGAVRSESQQSARGLLLSPTAEIDARPQLQIHADEVKCAHGATTGRLDPDMLFYLLSRGLDRNTAQSVLVFAFLSDVLTGMTVGSARTAIENALITQLPESQLLKNLR